MADLAAQREARRKKITENAESRMNRLLGLTNKSDQNNDSLSHSVSHSESQESPEPAYNTRLRSHGSAASVSLTSIETPTSRHTTPTVRHTTPTFRHTPTPVTTTDRTINWQLDEHTFTNFQTVAQEAPQQPPMENSDLTAKKTDISPKTVRGLTAQRLEIIRVVIVVITAWLARFYQTFGLGFFVFESIFAPFIVLELTFEFVIYSYLQHIPLNAARGNMMSAALMLCGMKQDILETYNNIMAHITSWISDFCLYVFSFIVLHILLT